MKKMISALIVAFLAISVNAQDTKSKEILNELSKKAKGYTSIKANFTKTYTKGSKSSKAQGKIMIKGSKFYVETGEGQNLYCDGRTVWTHVVDVNEVYKCPKNEAFEGEDIPDPSKLLTIWENDFKSRYLKEETIGGSKYHVINLHPLKPGSVKYHTITLKVNADKKEVEYITIQSKDGSKTTFHITSFKVNETISEGQFRYSGNAEIIDC